MVTKELVNNEQMALTDWKAFDGESDGTEDVPPIFPTIYIVQGTSRMDGADKHGGEFWHSDTETFETNLSIVALLHKSTRALFGNGEQTPLCRSVDGERPLPDQKLWTLETWADKQGIAHDVPPYGQPDLCDQCPLSRWENDERPPCGDGYEYLVVRADGSFARFRVSGTSIKPMRQFIASKCRPKRIPLYAYELTLSTVRRKSADKAWHELVVTGQLLGQEVALGYSDMLRAYRGEFERQIAEQAEAEPLDVTPRDEPSDITLPLRDRLGAK